MTKFDLLSTIPSLLHYFTVILFCLLGGVAFAQDSLREAKGSNTPLHHFSKKGQVPLATQKAIARNDSLSRTSRMRSAYSAYGEELKRAPFLVMNRGTVAFNSEYRSFIDTPYMGKDILQHQLRSTVEVTLAGKIPLTVHAYLRQSNSSLFRDIADVQVLFNGSGFKNNVQARRLEALRQKLKAMEDTLLARAYALKQREVDEVTSRFHDPAFQQRLVEANEILTIPLSTYDPVLPDSTNQQNQDSLRRAARDFIDRYQQIKERHARLVQQADSLRRVYDSSRAAIRQLQTWIEDPSLARLQQSRQYKKLRGIYDSLFQQRKSWLDHVRHFSVGRSPVSASELTAKNLSLTGISFEYNSWYFLSVSAGLVDYRFRDFALARVRRLPQYLFLTRLGIGNVERSYFIVSVTRGQKQLFSGSAAVKKGTVPLTGLSTEAKWQWTDHAYLLAELAQSFSSPDGGTPTATKQSGWRLTDKTNKALYLKGFVYLPSSASRLEGYYKYVGAGYQGFNLFQANAQVSSWGAKWNQNLLNRKLRIAAALSQNDFQNPYLNQHYKSNTVFKTLTATLAAKRFPSLTAGYMPMSQLTVVDSVVTESRFQTLTANAYHHYKIGKASGATTAAWSRFLNSEADTAWGFSNAHNLMVSQSFLFKRFTATLVASSSRTSLYSYTVLEENISIPLRQRTVLKLGATVSRLGRSDTRIGGSIGSEFPLFGSDVVSFRMERTHLPSIDGQLLANTLGQISFLKTLK